MRQKVVRMSRAVFGWPPRPATFAEKCAAVTELGRSHKITNLIETGTYRGDMVEAQRTNFEKIVSIELSESLWQSARSRFAEHSHICVLHGDSGSMLPDAISLASGQVVFWLDAHYGGGVTVGEDLGAPVLKELSIIAKRGNKGDVILIDDARLFGREIGYPRLGAVGDFVSRHFPDHSFKVENDLIRIVPAA